MILIIVSLITGGLGLLIGGVIGGVLGFIFPGLYVLEKIYKEVKDKTNS